MHDQLHRCWYEKLEKLVKLNDLRNEHLLIYLHDLLVNKTPRSLSPSDSKYLKEPNTEQYRSSFKAFLFRPFVASSLKICSTSFDQTSASIATNVWWHLGRVD